MHDRSFIQHKDSDRLISGFREMSSCCMSLIPTVGLGSVSEVSCTVAIFSATLVSP